MLTPSHSRATMVQFLAGVDNATLRVLLSWAPFRVSLAKACQPPPWQSWSKTNITCCSTSGLRRSHLPGQKSVPSGKEPIESRCSRIPHPICWNRCWSAFIEYLGRLSVVGHVASRPDGSDCRCNILYVNTSSESARQAGDGRIDPPKLYLRLI